MERITQFLQKSQTNRKIAVFYAHVAVSTALQGFLSLTMGGLPGAALLSARTIIGMVGVPTLFFSAAKWFLPEWLTEDTKGLTKMLCVGSFAAWSARAVAAPLPLLGELLAPLGFAIGTYFAPNLWEGADRWDWPGFARNYIGMAREIWDTTFQT